MAAKRLARTPLGRLGGVQDIAHAALFLASDESGWVMGQSLLVDGGATHALRQGAQAGSNGLKRHWHNGAV